MSNPTADSPADANGLIAFVMKPWVRLVILGGVVLAVWWMFRDKVDAAAVHAEAQRLDPVAAFVALVVLPLIGFPVSVLHVAAGMRFGAPLGLLLVAASIGLQLMVSYALVQRWRGRFDRYLRHYRRRIPAGAHRSVALFAVLMPGAPYVAINYVLPLIGVGLRTLLLYCWPLHVLRSTVTVLLGDNSDHLTPGRLAVLGGYALLLAIGSWTMFRRLRRQLANPPSAAGDPTRRA